MIFMRTPSILRDNFGGRTLKLISCETLDLRRHSKLPHCDSSQTFYPICVESRVSCFRVFRITSLSVESAASISSVTKRRSESLYRFVCREQSALRINRMCILFDDEPHSLRSDPAT